LKGKYLSEDGKSVDYAELRNDNLFKEFQAQSVQLADLELADLSPVQRKAFFISISPLVPSYEHTSSLKTIFFLFKDIYNTLTIHALSKVEPLPSSLLEVTNFWKHSAYKISGLVFSLDDIEHGILRGKKISLRICV
jgi:hypothetical protein